MWRVTADNGLPLVKVTGGAGSARWEPVLVGVDPGFSSPA
ncbi:uncharacterized protein METZ01_LOCUS286806 [marine metagenome]|uniref:Uncharacterized protein n=1 Tax=marine metagenome TaxID=408172 RepID=A0A382LFR0_9ZZZZ